MVLRIDWNRIDGDPVPTVPAGTAGAQGLAGRPPATMAAVLLGLGVRAQHVDQALARARVTGESLPGIMRDFGFAGEERVAEAIATHHGYPYFGPDALQHADLDAPVAEPGRGFQGYAPAGAADGGLLVVVSEPERVNEAANAFHAARPRIAIGSASTVQTLYRRRFGRTAEAFDAAVAAFERAAEAGTDADSPGLVQAVFFALMRHACYVGASDIYLFRSGAVGVIKLRRDGVGEIFRCLRPMLHEKILNKIVTESGVRAEDLRREPREALVNLEGDHLPGQVEELRARYAFRLQLAQGRDERSREAVIRILDRQSDEADFASLGFDTATEDALRGYLACSTGLVIVTGPTGSGKTTTLYGMLKEIDPVERAIQTIENPVEYRHGLWMQHELPRDMPEAEGARKMLNALLRMAPDVILFGEVRNDREVANLLIDAANTGHLVFTTLHTNSAVLAVNRLRRIGVQGDQLAGVLRGILAQRLVRALCVRCREPDPRQPTAEALLRAADASVRAARPMRARGCQACNGTGYRGRRMICELLDVSAQVRELLEAGAPASTLARAALPPSRTMWSHGLRLVAEGRTSIDELRRVADPSA